MKKVLTTYSRIVGRSDNSRSICISVNEEYPAHISIHEHEPVTGIVKHWGNREEIIKELEAYIALIKDLPTTKE